MNHCMHAIRNALFCALLCGFGASADAQDSVIGTFTVNGKTTTFSRVYATLESSPTEPSQQYLLLLVSDTALAAGDRTPDTLARLASAGAIRALKLRWRYGADEIAVVPYHKDIAESGRAFASLSSVNLSALDEKHVNAEFKAKMLGQTWFFNAIIKANIVKGGGAVLEPPVLLADAPPAAVGGATAGGNATELKLSLGRMGYEFKPDAFFQAIADRNPEAVTLFLRAGMSPNQKDAQNHYALNYAVLFCAQSPADSAAVIQALLAAKADVKTKDPDNGTTALVGAVQSCSPAAVESLIKAGSDLTAKSKGGMTALQLASIFQKPELVGLLEKAGAK